MRRGTSSVTRQMMEFRDRKPRGALSPVAVRMPGKVPVLLTFVFPLGIFGGLSILFACFFFLFLNVINRRIPEKVNPISVRSPTSC